MDLDIFVQKSIEQIIDGVVNAKKSKGENTIDPRHSGSIKEGTPHVYGRPILNIEFDVAVTVHEKMSGDIGAKITVFGAGIGSQLQTDNSSSTITRIKFSVPVQYTGEK